MSMKFSRGGRFASRSNSAQFCCGSFIVLSFRLWKKYPNCSNNSYCDFIYPVSYSFFNLISIYSSSPARAVLNRCLRSMVFSIAYRSDHCLSECSFPEPLLSVRYYQTFSNTIRHHSIAIGQSKGFFLFIPLSGII